jgi:predicted RNase H-like HicB family nuclease/uncharacterized protein YwgA
MGRTLREELIDKLFLLKLLQLLRNMNVTTGLTKLQKLVFLAERTALSEKIECFHYTYVKAKHGPYSVALEKDRTMLVVQGYLEIVPQQEGPGEFVQLSEKGEDALKLFGPLFERNKNQVLTLENVVREFGTKSLRDLLDNVYNLPARLRGQEGKKIADLPMRSPVLIPYKTRFEEKIKVTDEELEVMMVVLDPATKKFWPKKVKGREAILYKVRGSRYFSVVIPGLPGCMTHGLTKKEALNNAEEAIELYLSEAVNR